MKKVYQVTHEEIKQAIVEFVNAKEGWKEGDREWINPGKTAVKITQDPRNPGQFSAEVEVAHFD